MIEFYPQIKWIHVGAVVASGALFFLRFVLLQMGQAWARAWPIRYLSYTIDTILLTAALMLMVMLRQYPFVQSWLTAKVLLLVIYIVLGSAAITYARTRRVQLASGIAAMLVYLAIVSIARAHHPLGALAHAPHTEKGTFTFSAAAENVNVPFSPLPEGRRQRPPGVVTSASNQRLPVRSVDDLRSGSWAGF